MPQDAILLETTGNITLWHKPQKDEYQRIVRQTYVIENADGRRLGDVFTDEAAARALYERIVADEA